MQTWVVQRNTRGEVIRKAGPFAYMGPEHCAKHNEYMQIAQAHNQSRTSQSPSFLTVYAEDKDPGLSVAEANGFKG